MQMNEQNQGVSMSFPAGHKVLVPHWERLILVSRRPRPVCPSPCLTCSMFFLYSQLLHPESPSSKSQSLQVVLWTQTRETQEDRQGC